MKLASIVCCYKSDNKKYQKSHIVVYLVPAKILNINLNYKSLTGERDLDEYVDSVPVFLAQVVDHAGELVFQDVV